MNLKYRKMETEKRNDTQVHLNHCYQGEYKTNCKYGEDDTCPAKPKKEAEELKPMVDFILEIDWMTTVEFCDKYKVPHPRMVMGAGGQPDIRKSADMFLQVDAIKQKMFVEHAKKLARQTPTKIQQYTEEDIRNAFLAGDCFGREDYKGDSQHFVDVEEYIESLNKQGE